MAVGTVVDGGGSVVEAGESDGDGGGEWLR